MKFIIQAIKHIAIGPKNADEPMHWSLKAWFCFVVIYGTSIYSYVFLNNPHLLWR